MSEIPAVGSDHPRGPEPGVEPEGINSGALLMWGFVSVVLTVCVMFVAAALYFQYQTKIDEQVVISPKYPETEKIVTDQLGVLASYKAPEAEGKPEEAAKPEAAAEGFRTFGR